MKAKQTDLTSLYLDLLKPRMIEERMLLSLRQGKISKWFSAWGQEAISVGATRALKNDEYICTMHRNLGVFTSRKVELSQLFAQFQGKASGFTKGRDRSFHFGSKKHHIVGMISHLGSQMGVAAGIALNEKLNKNNKVSLVFTGDGGASEGDFHEAVNLAAVWKLPLIILVENNQWGLSTPSNQQFAMESFADKGKGYGIDSESIDGNDLLQVYSTVNKWATRIRKNPRPVLIECNTFRIRGHEEASGTAYYPKGLIEKWEVHDPLTRFEEYLKKENLLDDAKIESYRQKIKAEILEALSIANNEEEIQPNTRLELQDVYAPFTNEAILPKNKITYSEKRFVDAISDGLKLSMQRHKDLIVMGQDIGHYGGVFKVTEGFVEEFGEERVRNTPICEAAVVGAALGLSISQRKSIVEMQFSDFVTEGFNQIVNNLAKVHYRWGQNADVVIRMPTGAGVAAGPFHSQSTEAWFTRVPGLKVVYPSNPNDAKGLLLQAIEDPNPVLFFEHKKLYRSLKKSIPDNYYTCQIGKGKLVTTGNNLSIVTYGMGVHWCKSFIDDHSDYAIELIDLRSLLPWDKEMVHASVKKTGKLLLVTEDRKSGSWLNEIAQNVNEELFEFLDAPVKCLGAISTPIPFSASLEHNFLPQEKLAQTILEILNY